MADNTDDLIISISTDQATLRRSIKRIESDLGTLAGSVKKQFETVGKSVDNSLTTSLQNRINGMTGVAVKAAKEWTGALADQGAELERLRAKYSPLFNTINNYKSAVADIRRAHSVGAISANEMAAAISRERQAALASTAAIKGRNRALAETPASPSARNAGSGSFQTGNIAAQFQDIGVTAFGGMNPLTIALQQGTQLSAVLSQMRGEGQSTGKALLGAFTSIISPLSLVTIGLVAGSAALIQYFTSGEDQSEKLKAQLEAQVTLIETVAQRWGDAYPALKAYSDELTRARDAAQLQDAQSAATSRLYKDLAGALDQLVKVGPEVSRALRDATSPEAAGAAVAYEQAISDLRSALQDGKDPSDAFGRATQALATIIEATGSAALKGYGDQFDILAGKIDKATGKAAAFRMELPPLGTLGEMWSEGGKLYNSEQFQPTNPGVPTKRPLVELEGLPGADKAQTKADTAAQRSANAYRDLIKSADDRIAQMQMEAALLGKFGNEADTARFALDLMQQAEDKGRSLSPDQRKEIEAKAATYGKLADQLAKAKLQQDLLEQRRFQSMSAQDQQVYTTLKQYGLSTDMNSGEAGQIRQSLRDEAFRDDIKAFASDFKNNLLNSGGDIGKAFAMSLQTALMDQASKMWDNIIQQIFGGVTAPGGSGGGGGTISSIGAAIFGGGSGESGGASGGAVDKASSLLGANENTSRSSINSYLQAGGVNLDAAQQAWCAGFVNSSLAQIGVKGSGSSVANSFQNWGSSIDPSKVMRGDVLLQSRGLGADQTGGHVGFATGASRMTDGQLQLQMLSGNSGNAVSNTWVNAAEVQAKRATEAANALGKVADSSKVATQGLGSLGQLSTSFFPSAPSAPSGGGGLGSIFSSLFGGGLSSAQIAKYTPMVGLFADGGTIRGPGSGTSDSIPIMASNEEFIVNARQSKKHRALLHAINGGTLGHFATGGLVGGGVSAPVAPMLRNGRSAASGNQPGTMIIQIDGANGDDHVMTLVRQGVNDGLGQYNKSQERGGFGTVQGQFNKRKG
jgi:uncharacterized protein (TIGR02594 family)